jgi:hypothetical protein
MGPFDEMALGDDARSSKTIPAGDEECQREVRDAARGFAP